MKVKLFFVSLIFLTATAMFGCSSNTSTTSVRMLSLTYEKLQKDQLEYSFGDSNILLSKSAVNKVEAYIFPGDILIFSIELDDPKFEFISLLSIKFNNEIIRANVDDSIFTTRDCGTNICVDFPFEVNANVDTYSVQEVKFAKLNSDSGINAIIDKGSSNTVNIDVYTDDTAPFVNEAVDMLNELVTNREYFENTILSEEYREYFINRMLNSSFVVLNWQGHIDESFGWEINGIDTEPEEGGDSTYDYTFFGNSGYVQVISASITNSYWDEINKKEIKFDFSPLIMFTLDLEKYSSTYFYNEGNMIYVNILGVDYFMIEFFNDMRLKPLNDYR